jgi:hypothetical protein
MKDELVSFEVAELAKKKGFDWMSYFYEDGEFFYEWLVYEDSQIDVSRVILRPTQSLLQRWLREEYQIIVNSYANASGYCWESHYTPERGGTHIADSEFSGPNESGCWNTYEQALEKGLQKALELIK